MKSLGFFVAGLFGAMVGCTGEVAIPSTAAILCSEDAQCPESFQCNLALGLCQASLTNSAPLVSLEILPARPRWLRGVTFEVIVSDADADPVDLDLQFTLGDGTPCPASSSSALTNLESSPTGVAHEFVWTALSDAQSSDNCGLGVANVLVPADSVAGDSGPCTVQGLDQPTGAGADEVVGCVLVLEDLELLVTPTDRAAAPRSGGQVSDGDVVGDKPPVVTPLFNPEGQEYSDSVPVEFLILDEVTESGVGTDLVDIEIEFSVDGGQTWVLAAVLGPVENLLSVPSGAAESDAVPDVVVWHSDEPLPTDRQSAGGIGAGREENVIIRMRGTSRFGDQEVIGPWSQSRSIVVDNS